MPKVRVQVFKRTGEVVRVTRPLRHRSGKPVIKYKKRFWPLINGCEVYLDEVKIAPDDPPHGDEHRDQDSPSVPDGPASSPEKIQWDILQSEVISAAADERLLVGAGPGTGKTAVACARVSHLIDQEGLEPSRIWLISFTRTAVREIRDRIAAYLRDASAAYAVKIATLDSHAWTIHSGFVEKARILGSYEDNIQAVLDQLQENEYAAEYVESVEHLVVDEAQDIVGIRADLVLEFIRKLSASSGATVFADEAQAIYGFSDDKEVLTGEVRTPPLPERIRSEADGRFRECELLEVHRTDSPQLLKIFSDTRRKVVTPAGRKKDKLTEIRDDIISLSHGIVPKSDAWTQPELEDTFILYRRRCDVLLAASMLTRLGIAHRVRMSGLPTCLASWIGVTLSEHTEAYLHRERFVDLWTARVHGTYVETCDAEEAWSHLVRIAGHTNMVVDMGKLRQRLGRKQPPAELCHAEMGLRGPVVGTIHASKGREADTVHLMLTRTHGRNVDQDEESRVVFVGATRGRSRLLIGHEYPQFASRVQDTGRAYRLLTQGHKPYAQVEIGRDTDFDAAGLTGRNLFECPDAVRASQARILGLADQGVGLVATIDRGAGFAYRLREHEQERCLAVLSQNVNSDLFTVANAVRAEIGGGRRRPPDTIPHLHVRGLRTIVLPPDAPETETLYEPWKSSGMMVAPLILGYSRVRFPYWRRRRS